MNFADHEYQRAARELAEEDFDDYMGWINRGGEGFDPGHVHEYVEERLQDHAIAIMRGGDYLKAAMDDIRRDVIGILTEMQDHARVCSALRAGTEPYDEEAA